MSSPISDARLDEAVRQALGAGSEPSADFGDVVLVQAARAAAARTRRRRRTLSLAAGACLFAAGLGVWSFEQAAERASRRAALIDEHRRLQSALEELRALAERRARLPLGGDATTDLYLDLTKIPSGPAGGRSTS